MAYILMGLMAVRELDNHISKFLRQLFFLSLSVAAFAHAFGAF